MLRIMRESSQWIMWVVILGVGAVFVLYLGIGGGFQSSGGPGVVVDVDGRRFTTRDVYRVRQRQEAEYRRVLGDDFDSSNASEFLDEMAASSLMRMALVAHTGEQMGLRVSDEEVRAYLKRMSGAVDESGRLDRDVITSYAEREYGSVRRFQEALRDEILMRKVSRLLSESVSVSDAEARDALRHRQTEVSIAFVRFEADPSAGAAEVSAEEVRQFLMDHPERVQADYDARLEEFERPEQVRARHILIRLAEDADADAEAAARERIDAIAKRIREGADFVDVALEVSEDPGSKDQGGDLGFFPRGRMVKAFEEAAFSLEPGTVSEVIRSPHGLHLIRVEEKRAAVVVPFEEARESIARDLIARDRAQENARAQAEAIAGEIRAGKSLIDAAREAGLSIERTEPFRRRPDSYVPNLGAAPDLVTAAFGLREEAPSCPEIFAVQGGELVLIQLMERTDPTAEELDAQLDEERERLATERKNQIEQLWVAQRRDALAAKGKLLYDLSSLER